MKKLIFAITTVTLFLIVNQTNAVTKADIETIADHFDQLSGTYLNNLREIQDQVYKMASEFPSLNKALKSIVNLDATVSEYSLRTYQDLQTVAS